MPAGKTTAAYRVAFRAAGIMGGASALQMAIRLVRAKAFAVLLGPAGTGLIGLYQQVTGLVTQASNFGITQSGVRQIAEATGKDDRLQIARTERTVRRAAWLTGLLGCLLQLSLCWFLSKWTFGDTVHWKAIAILSVIPLLGALNGGRIARIQGFRRIGDLARQNVFGALSGTIAGVAIVWFFGFKGIVPQMIVVAALTLAFSFYFSKKITIHPTAVTWRDSVKEARGLLGLGLSLMGSGIAEAFVAYLIAAIIAHKLGIGANGLYIAGWSLSGLYANFVLNAMGADYYPRLTAVANKPAEFVPMMNQQAEIALLIAVPGIVGTLAFAPLAIRIFYTGAYSEAYSVMRWLILGVSLRLVGWPLGFLLLAKGAATLHFFVQMVHQGLYVLFVVLMIHWTGLTGVGTAFAAVYIVHVVLIYFITHYRYGFSFSAKYVPIFSVCLALTLGAFFTNDISLIWLRYGAGVGLSAAACLFCGLLLKRLLGLRSMREVAAFLAGMAGFKKKG